MPTDRKGHGSIETEGVVRLYVNVNIPVETIRTWSPERIEALFAGLAAVQSAANGEPPAETDDGYEYFADMSAPEATP